MQEVLLIWHAVVGEWVSQSRFSICGLEEGCWNMGCDRMGVIPVRLRSTRHARSHVYHP